MKLNEAQVRAIHEADDLQRFTREELRAADQWIKDYALAELAKELSATSSKIRDYVMLMARCHYGSMETDALLASLRCYPAWMN